jgi:translation initiation factor 2B subunit (eIF-2B alpha/beta/delta family)
MATIVVPSAEALVTALGESSRESLVTLAKALSVEIEATNSGEERRAVIRLYLAVLKEVERMDRFARSEARMIARSEAAIDWMSRRDEERAQAAANRAAEKLARETIHTTPGPASSLVDELATARKRKIRRTRVA